MSKRKYHEALDSHKWPHPITVECAAAALSVLDSDRSWMRTYATELVCVALIDGLTSAFPDEVVDEWKKRFDFAFDEAATIRILNDEESKPRLGWNDYWMVRWQLSRDPKIAEHIVDRIAQHADHEENGITRTGAWMLRSMSERYPDLLEQVKRYSLSDSFNRKFPALAARRDEIFQMKSYQELAR